MEALTIVPTLAVAITGKLSLAATLILSLYSMVTEHAPFGLALWPQSSAVCFCSHLQAAEQTSKEYYWYNNILFPFPLSLSK